MTERDDMFGTAADLFIIDDEALLPESACRFVGIQEGMNGKMVPVYRVKAGYTPKGDADASVPREDQGR